MTLNQQSTDVVARTDYNQFTVILSRASREELFRDTDMIRQAISEIKFVTPQREEVTITISGGFVMKTNKMSLKDAIQRSEENMRYAQKMGGNKIARTAEDDN
jgi:diguanylate cyclase (GGDEF)-like protein